MPCGDFNSAEIFEDYSEFWGFYLYYFINLLLCYVLYLGNYFRQHYVQ